MRLWFGIVIRINHPHIHKVNRPIPHMFMDVGLRGLYQNIKGLLFLRKWSRHLTLLLYTVMGLFHAHIQNDKHCPFVEVCGPQGPLMQV